MSTTSPTPSSQKASDVGLRQRLKHELGSLRSRVIILLSLALVPIGAVAIANAYYGYEHYKSTMSNQALAAGEDAARRSEALIASTQNLLTVFAAVPTPILSDRCSTLVSRLLLQYSKYSNVAAFDSSGNLICSALKNERPALAARWFREAANGKTFTITAEMAKEGMADSAILAVGPLPGERTGRSSGVLAVYIQPSAFEQALGDAVLPEGAAMILMDQNGAIIAERSNQLAPKVWLPSATELDRQKNSAGVFDAEGQDGIDRRYLTTSLSGNVIAIYGIPTSSIGASANFLLYSNAASATLMWLAALFTAGIAISHLVTRPLRQVKRGIRHYSAEGGSAPLTNIDEMPDEIRSLAETLNTMADTIARRDAELMDAVASQKALTREVHHRVRNNLQIINSLMNLQSRRATAPSEIAIFAEVQRRVTALGLVHGAIYQGDDMRSVQLGKLLTDLCASIELGMGDKAPALFSHADEMAASPDIAVPLAFLVTEVIGEVLHRKVDLPTEIHIELRKADMGATLQFSADAPLFHSGTDGQAANRKAINLLAGLTRQLGATQNLSEDRKLLRVDIPAMGLE